MIERDKIETVADESRNLTEMLNHLFLLMATGADIPAIEEQARWLTHFGKHWMGSAVELRYELDDAFPSPKEISDATVIRLLKGTIQRVLNELPSRRDWLDPDLEKQMRDALGL